jgi:uncharacterized lipoprotein (TIGR02269 family)
MKGVVAFGGMTLLTFKRWLALLGVLLTACATSSPTVHAGDVPGTVASWEAARTDPSCVVPLCDEEGCALWRCRDLVEVDENPIVLARGTVGLRPPLVGHPSRWWGIPQAAPGRAEPVFEIPWHNWKLREQHARRPHPLACMLPPEPLEKHHIFPQQKDLAKWFDRQGIDIHAFTIPLRKSVHSWLHSGGPKGGQWNEAWRQFKANNEGATAEEMWRFAGELMSRFGVLGPFVPYCGET